MRAPLLCVFAKAPVPGRVKTRLARHLGDVRAAALARAFLLDTWSGLGCLGGVERVLALDGAPDLLPPELCGAEVWPQPEGHLGRRLEEVLARALGRSDRAVALGADTPGLPPRLLEETLLALERADAVLGPSADGGFYLLGLRRPCTGLLEDVPWSTAQTLACTRRRLEEGGLHVVTVSPWFDVDEPADLARLGTLLHRGEVVAPRTLDALRELGDVGRMTDG
ncbi:MAG: TIGR04282 family arsenosugar biosynthesis glycosyltransferase [Myxococcaceae bacterium]|nr:TIGR04282 family arsenosugar biosynthesis glycosyltransferase [Myxococcaceae bacterium]MCI0671455.1 TIGR04282 family arsenosugar biosynthesis glycosyltransferase [Myxococcaceae bacterium]